MTKNEHFGKIIKIVKIDQKCQKMTFYMTPKKGSKIIKKRVKKRRFLGPKTGKNGGGPKTGPKKNRDLHIIVPQRGPKSDQN